MCKLLQKTFFLYYIVYCVNAVTGNSVSVWSADEWGLITGANRPTSDTPSWLQVFTVSL